MTPAESLKQLSRQIAYTRKVLIQTIRQIVSVSDLRFYSSGYVDKKETDRCLKLAELPRALRIRLPVPTGDEAEDGRLSIKHLTKTGYVADAEGGGCAVLDWSTQPIENLAKLAPALLKHLSKTK